MSLISKCLPWMISAAMLVSCRSQREVSPRGSESVASHGRTPVSYGQSQTSSYPDVRDYVEMLSSLPAEAARSGGKDPSSSGSGDRKGGGGAVRHVVTRGDTLFSIGRRYGLTAESLKAANGLTTDTIFPGEVLRIPRR